MYEIIDGLDEPLRGMYADSPLRAVAHLLTEVGPESYVRPSQIIGLEIDEKNTVIKLPEGAWMLVSDCKPSDLMARINAVLAERLAVICTAVEEKLAERRTDGPRAAHGEALLAALKRPPVF